MGGTSTDVCLIEALKVPVTGEQKIAHYANRTPQIEINSVGAGGGSIAWVDAGDILMVGPQSAGADTGPCLLRPRRYARRRSPTPTSCSIACRPARRSARGHIPLDRTLALEALDGLGRRCRPRPVTPRRRHRAHRRRPHGLRHQADLDRATATIRATSSCSPYGGAGPMHAAAIADELEIGRILVPVGPRQLLRHSARSSPTSVSTTRAPARCSSTTGPRRRSRQSFRAWSRRRATISAPRASPRRQVEMQPRARHALSRPVMGAGCRSSDAPDNTGASAASGKAIGPVERILAAFADVHDRRFGHRSGGAVEIVSFRMAAVGRVAKPRLPLLPPTAPRSDARSAMRDVHFGTRFHACAVYARDRLVLDEVVAGPAVIEESGSTTIVPPGWTARTMAHGELLMERSGHG